MGKHANKYLTPRTRVSQGLRAQIFKNMGADLEIGARSVARPRAECYKPLLSLPQLDCGPCLF